MKKYLKVTVYQHNGKTFENPLKLSEAHLIVNLAKENNWVQVEYATMNKEKYQTIFGGLNLR